MEKLNPSPNLKGRFCPLPFSSIELHLNKKAFVCCPTWLKKDIGTYTKENILEIWNSKEAQEIRESIIDGSYRYCDHFTCPHIQANTLPEIQQLPEQIRSDIAEKKVSLSHPPSTVMFTFDTSCNLTCPSCRSEKNSLTSDSPQYFELKELSLEITRVLLQNPHSHININLTGSGDPFASLVYRHYLEQIDGSLYPNLSFDFQTNGLLLTPLMWERIHKIHKKIREICVSIDAITPETYSVLRKGGNFETVMENMKFIAQLRKERKFHHLRVNFIVQQKNYREIPAFAKFFSQLGCDKIYFSKIEDWGSMSSENFLEQAVWRESHPDHQHFLAVLADPFLTHHTVSLGNISSFYQIAIKKKMESMSKLSLFFYKISIFFNYNFLKRKFFRTLEKIIDQVKHHRPN